MLKTTDQFHFSIMFPKYWNNLCIYNKVIDHFSHYIFSCQFGFQQHRSTLQQLLIYINDLVTSKNETDAIYLDISKAFDSVSHKILLNKLRSI